MASVGSHEDPHLRIRRSAGGELRVRGRGWIPAGTVRAFACRSGPERSSRFSGPRPTQAVRLRETTRWTTIAPASPRGPSTVSRRSSARMPDAIPEKAKRRFLTSERELAVHSCELGPVPSDVRPSLLASMSRDSPRLEHLEPCCEIAALCLRQMQRVLGSSLENIFCVGRPLLVPKEAGLALVKRSAKKPPEIAD